MLPVVQVIGLSQVAAAKLCADKIRVNCVAPTAVATVRRAPLPTLDLPLDLLPLFRSDTLPKAGSEAAGYENVPCACPPQPMTANFPRPADPEAARVERRMWMRTMCPMHQTMVSASAMVS